MTEYSIIAATISRFWVSEYQYETIQAIPREATRRRVVFPLSLLDTDASKRSVSRKQLLTADRNQIKSILDSVGLPFFCSTTFKLQIRAGQGSSTLVESGRVLPLKLVVSADCAGVLDITDAPSILELGAKFDGYYTIEAIFMPLVRTLIHFVLLVSRQGKVRLAKWYSPYTQKERSKGIVGFGIGLAAMGNRAIVEIQFILLSLSNLIYSIEKSGFKVSF